MQSSTINTAWRGVPVASRARTGNTSLIAQYRSDDSGCVEKQDERRHLAPRQSNKTFSSDGLALTVSGMKVTWPRPGTSSAPG